MQTVPLGTTGLSVSPIALGTMQFTWTVTEQDAYQLLDAYTEAEGNLIDTADMYTQWVPGNRGGEAETIIGKWIHQKKNRDKLVLSSKVRSKMWEDPDGEGLSRKHILKACEDSLKRLQVDYLDLYFSHWPDEATPQEETLGAYQTLIKQGKVRFIGASNYSPEQLREALTLSERNNLPRYQVIQALYNLADRDHFEHELLPVVKQHRLAVLAYSPLASGLLTGRYRKDKPLTDYARASFVKDKLTPKNLKLLAVLEEVAANHKATMSQVALAWLLHQPGVTGLITGADTTKELAENLHALILQLSPADIASLEQLGR
jgi:aryl-alcohol dehydrogenase-like predicted oxidoreductase